MDGRKASERDSKKANIAYEGEDFVEGHDCHKEIQHFKEDFIGLNTLNTDKLSFSTH